MSALDLDALERRARKGIVLNPDETLALITRLRAAEGARDDWRCEVEALQAERDTARVEAGRLRECLRVLTREHDAIITRLRAAEARTAWQPIETAPLWPDLSPSPTYIMGLRVNRAPVAFVQPAPGVYTDEYGNRVFPIAWAPLPAAPEAP